MRLSMNEVKAGRLINGYDYEKQVWVKNGVYVRCGHPENMTCGCFGRKYAGYQTPPTEK